MKIISIIPARGRSKGIPRKNIKLLNGKPLLTYSIEQSINSTLIDKTIVSTEDYEIADIAHDYNVQVVKRPDYLAEDDIPLEPILECIIKKLKPDISVLLQPTSPLRGRHDIDNALILMDKEGYDSVFSVCKNPRFIWGLEGGRPVSLNYDYKNRKRRQDISKGYVENGSIYAFRTQPFLMGQNRICNRICGNYGIYIMRREYSFEIDEPFDFWLCEQIMNDKLKIQSNGVE